MYRKMVRLLLFIFIIALDSKTSFAAIPTQNIRIGLEYKYKSVQSIPITDKKIMFGYESNGIYIPETTLNSESGFTMQTTNDYYVSSGSIYNSYEQALSQAQSFYSSGMTAIPASLSNSVWTVYFGGYASFNQANATLSSVGSQAQVVSQNNKMTKLTTSSNTLIICNNSIEYPRIAGVQGDIITLGDRRYRGQIEFNRNQGPITAINVINIEDYLCGTVPSEMPSKWNIEAIKAQTVAARTYTARTRKHTNEGYDLCDGVHCQAYVGYNNENDTSNQAVKATEGQKIYYNNELIDAIYFSSSGGYTDNSENVWDNVFPYLKAVPDTYESEYKSWTRTITLNNLNTLLSRNGANIGNAVGMKIDSTTEGGRVNALTIIGTNGSKTLQKENIKTFFSPSLDSNMFQILNGSYVVGDIITIQSESSTTEQSLENVGIRAYDGIINQVSLNNPMYVLDSNGQTISYSIKAQSSTESSDTFVLSGKGYGHGVGMSQYGAKGMAEAGFSYIDILKYYYKGVTIQ